MQTKENIKQDGDNRLKIIDNGVVTKAQVTEDELVLYIYSQILEFAEILDPTIQKDNAEARDAWVAMTKGATKDAVQEGTKIINEWVVTHYTPESLRDQFKTSSPTVFRIMDEELDRCNKPIEALNNSFDESNLTVKLAKWLVLRDALRDEVNRRKQAKEQKPKLKRAVLPSELPHYTFREARNPSIAIANADEWTEVIGETALMHAKDGEPIQTKLIAGSNLDWWDAPATCDNLRDELKTLGVRGVFFFNLTLAMVLQLQERHITVELNDLTKLFGWSSSTAAKNEERRRTLFRWLTLFDNISVHGNRGGAYKDKLTKQVLDTTIQEKLFMISGLERPDQSEQEIKTNGRLAPFRVTLTCGPWLERFRGDDKILHYFGNILKLSGLPTDQAHGEWALSIGMALSQLWRERAAHYTEVKREGDNKRETVAYDRPFTRFEIFKLFPPGRFRVNDILNSSDPARAIKYWDSAIKLLQETKNQTQENKKQISHYKELTGIPLPRQGWQDIWLNQHKFDIRPTGAARNEAVEISKSAKTKRRTWVKRKSKAAKTS
jgi:hypothetical protein